MEIAVAASQALRRRATAVAPCPTVQRDWYPTRAAAAMTGLSERTLRRYIQQSHWREGFHYRWITRVSRRTLEIHVPRAIRLMEQSGWG